MKKENLAMLCDFYEFTMANGYISTYFSARCPTTAALRSRRDWSR